MLILADTEKYKKKEEMYVRVREAEGRIVPDDLLRQLPAVPGAHPQSHEWMLRQVSLGQLIKYLRKNSSDTLNILDVGCGNGWMSHKLSLAGHTVTAVDLNLTELTQAEKVFGSSEHLRWVYADVLNDQIPGAPFDILLFSASCQYFASIEELTKRLLPVLKDNGEIHLVDSMFYNTSESYAAKARSVAYYTQLGFPEMAAYYFHHTTRELKVSGYTRLYPRFFSFKKSLEWWVYKKLSVSQF